MNKLVKVFYIISLIFGIITFIMGCSVKPDGQKSDQANSHSKSHRLYQTYDSRTNTDLLKSVDRTNTLIGNTRARCFSDSIKKDTFRLEIKGPEWLKSVAIFSIVSHTGKEIYYDEYPSGNLLNDEEDTSKIRKRLKIERVAKNFFNEESFRVPALMDLMDAKGENPYHEDYIGKENYNDLLKRKFSVSFVYQYGYPGTCYVAFITKDARAKIIYSSN